MRFSRISWTTPRLYSNTTSLKKGSAIETKHVHVHSSVVHNHLAYHETLQQGVIRVSSRSYTSRSIAHLHLAQVVHA